MTFDEQQSQVQPENQQQQTGRPIVQAKQVVGLGKQTEQTLTRCEHMWHTVTQDRTQSAS